MDVTRFAPSPTGYLHLGHAFSALFAAGQGERFLLRIEDIDPGRCRPEFETAIFEDLAWLGLEWETPVLRQSDRFEDYKTALAKLTAQSLIYPCFCTRGYIRAEIDRAGGAPQGPDGPIYPGLCRSLSSVERQERLAAGEAHALRLDSAKAVNRAGPLLWTDRARGIVRADPGRFGDVVLARKDTPTSYHLAVTVDDAQQGITLVTRGEDLAPATDIHRLLQALLDLPVPEYHHHRLLTDRTGKRYAKRERALTLRTLREAGKTPDQIHSMLRAGENP